MRFTRWAPALLIAIPLAHAGTASAAFDAHITEILTDPHDGPGGTYPQYVELFYLDAPAEFDFVVLRAEPTRELRIEQVVTVEPSAANNILVIHQDDWPAAAPFQPQRFALPAGEALGFGAGAFPTARRLVIFNQTTGWIPGTNIPEVDDWPATLQPVEVLALSLDGGAIEPLDSTRPPLVEDLTLALNHGDAALRLHDGGDFLDDFVTGPVDDQLAFSGGAALNPGHVNESPPVVAAPEPATALVMGLLAALAAGRRGAAAQPHRRRAAGHPLPPSPAAPR